MNPTTRQNGTITFSPGGVPKIPGVLGGRNPSASFIKAAEVTVTFGYIFALPGSHRCPGPLPELLRPPSM